MSKSKLAREHKAVFEGKEYTLTTHEWADLVGRSATYLYDKMNLAESKVIPLEKRMQFAIEQKVIRKWVAKSYSVVSAKKRGEKEAAATREYGSVLRRMAIGVRT